MIQPFIEWLRTSGLPFDASLLGDHLVQLPMMILQEPDTVKTFSEIWPNTPIVDGSKIVACLVNEVWQCTAMVDVKMVQLGPFLFDLLGYIPRHVLIEWYVTPFNMQVRGLCGAVGATGLVETFDKAVITIFNLQGNAVTSSDSEQIKAAPEQLGLWKFSGMAAMLDRKLLGISEARGGSPNVWSVRPIMGRHYGLQ